MMEEHEKDSTKSESKNDALVKNLIAVVILLGGITIGSFFFDIGQILRGEGFSQKAVKNAQVVSFGGKTWVSYDDPKIDVAVFTAPDCAGCAVSEEVLVWLRRIVPTIVATEENVREVESAQKAEELGIKNIPSFVFSRDIENTDFFVQAPVLFEEVDEGYVFKTAELGVPVAEYLALPETERAISIGNEEAPVQVVEYSDFACAQCQTFHPVIEKVLNEYPDEVRYVYKHLPLEAQHPRARDAALAAECAHEQEKFLDYANILFARQNQWTSSEDNARFVAYAREARLDREQFSQCLTDQRHADKVSSDVEEARGLGVVGTPSLFVNGEFLQGVVPYETLSEIIEGMLPEEETEQAGS